MQFVQKFFLVVCLIATTHWVHAQVDADPLPGDPKLVVFQFDANNSYRVFTKPLASTHIQLDNDERLKIFALGDTAGWMTAQRDNNVFIKPRYPNISTSGTLITNKRTYQFIFRSTSENNRWYQRVSFQDPNDMMIEATEIDRRQLANLVTEKPGSSVAEIKTSQPVSPELLNFDYEVSGDAGIKPANIFDDGFATYIQMRQAEEVPAVFRMVDKDVELVDYILKGNTIYIPKLLDGGMLKLGNQEVRFVNRKRAGKNFLNGLKGLW